MTMIHLILVDMVDQASGLLAHNHGVLEINVGSMHVPSSKDLLPHPLQDHEPHLLPRAPHSSSVTSHFSLSNTVYNGRIHIVPWIV